MARFPRLHAFATGTCILLCGGGACAAAKQDQDEPTFKFTAEPVANIAGGKKAGATYAQQLEVNLKFNLQKVTGLNGLSAHVTFVNRLGENVSARFAGDNLFQSQAIYGGTHHAPIHLVQAYLEEKADTLDVAGGRLPVGEAFANSPLYCQFMNTAICGYPHSLPAKTGFTAFPNSTWGARVRVSASDSVSLEGGAYQVRPKLGGRWGFNWGWSGTTGIYLPFELRFEPKLGAAELPGHYKVGFAYDTSDYPDNHLDALGRPFVLSGAAPRIHSSRYSWYALADQMLVRHGEGDRNGLVAMAGFVHSDPRDSQIASFAFAGLLDQGILPGRGGDTAGLVLSYAAISDSLAATQRLQQGLGLPLAGKAAGVQSHEFIVEADYDVKLGKHFHVMPDVQYVVRPGATNAYRNALLVGGRLTAQF